MFALCVERRLCEWYARVEGIEEGGVTLMQAFPRWVNRDNNRLTASGVTLDFVFKACPRVAPRAIEIREGMSYDVTWNFADAPVLYVDWSYEPGGRPRAVNAHDPHARFTHRASLLGQQRDWMERGSRVFGRRFAEAVGLWAGTDGVCGMGTYYVVLRNKLSGSCGPRCKMALPPCSLALKDTPLPLGGSEHAVCGDAEPPRRRHRARVSVAVVEADAAETEGVDADGAAAKATA